MTKFSSFFLATTLMILMTAGFLAPAQATEPGTEQQVTTENKTDSGFGNSFFANQEHPGFADTDSAAQSAAGLEPAAGGEDPHENGTEDSQALDTSDKADTNTRSFPDVDITNEADPVRIPAIVTE